MPGTPASCSSSTRAFRLSTAFIIALALRARPASTYCCLLYQAPLSEDARQRLQAIAETTDGFEIAERDLLLRGPGDFFGTRQAGIPTFRSIDLLRDRDLLDLARREAVAWLDAAPPTPSAIAEMLQTWETRFKLIESGSRSICHLIMGHLVLECSI